MDFKELLTDPFRTEIARQSFEAYLEEEGVNPSWLVHMSKSPKHFVSAAERASVNTPHTLVGSATHALIFEPRTFGDMYAVYEGVRNKRHKAYAAFLEETGNKTVLTPAEMHAAESVANAVLSDPIAGPLIDATDHELSVFAPLVGVQCKGRVDACGGGYLMDVKTTSDVSMGPFGRIFANFSYAMKLAIYRELLRENGEDVQHVVLITVETSDPYDVACVEVPEVVVDTGWTKALRLLAKFKECEQSGRWPGVANNQWYELALPNWSMPEDEVLEVFEG